jgi:hypothetical protein
MRKVILIIGLLPVLAGPARQAGAQSGTIELAHFDIVGLKLGQSLPEGIEGLKKHNPRFRIEVRRVGLERWDNQPSCGEEVERQGGEFSGLPNMCGNWSDGMGLRDKDRKEQEKIRPGDSLIAGIIAYDDQRQFGPKKKGRYGDELSGDLLRAGEETVALLVTPEVGKEKIVLISRAKTYPDSAVAFDELKSQVFARYAVATSIVEGLESTSPRNMSAANLFLGDQPLTEQRHRGMFQHCRQGGASDYQEGEFDSMMLWPAWPSTVAARCGNIILTRVKSNYRNNRYAHGFSVIWFDQQAVFRLSRDRVLEAKRMRDLKFNRSSRPAFKEKL